MARRAGASTFCCIELAPTCATPDAAPLQASNYDQSCTMNSDCLGVNGDVCDPCMCPNATINASAQAQYRGQYQAERQKARPVAPTACFCTFEPDPCCLGGVCQFGDQCQVVVENEASADAADASAE